jgi:UDP-N-acetylmuramyl pentapeptide phosphotransferase/UDP-N-acetylglucosamine-1-phosphate transferase
MWLRGWAKRRAILAVPNERSLHDHPMPQGGGIGIVVITLAGFLVYAARIQEWTRGATLAFLLGAVVIAAISWVDDLRTLPVALRLIAHGIAAVVVILGVGTWQELSLPLLGEIDLGWLGIVITFVWIVGLTNAYNFMDGIDGIAGSQAVAAGLGWAILGWLGDQHLVGVLGLLLASTCLGFLGHNWPPARIFMGDVGSAFLGYSLAFLPVVAAQDAPRYMVAGVLLVWPFIFDTVFTFIRRLMKGENVLSAHRSHLYQRLILSGYSHRYVTLLYILLALTGMLLAFAWMRWPTFGVGIGLAMGCVAIWGYVVQTERRKPLP